MLQFDPTTGNFIKAFITTMRRRLPDQLNGPEGLASVLTAGSTSPACAPATTNETDKILIFDGPGGAHPGACIGKFDLEVGASESTAAALLFGPGGDLFVPITNAFSADVIR